MDGWVDWMEAGCVRQKTRQCKMDDVTNADEDR